VQLVAEKEILTVVASLVVDCCAIKMNVIVASRLYYVAEAQFTVEKEGSPLQFMQKCLSCVFSNFPCARLAQIPRR